MAQLYIIDPKVPFEGFTQNIINKEGYIKEEGWKFMLEEYREWKKNPYLIGITEEELELKHKELRQSLLEKEFEEIDRETYEMYMNGVPPVRLGFYVPFDYFFVSECYSYDLYMFCFRYKARYFAGLRSIKTDSFALREKIYEYLKKRELISAYEKDFIHEERELFNNNWL